MDRPAIEKLACDFIPQMEGIARGMTRSFPRLQDEAISAGLLGIGQAIGTYTPAVADDFVAYAATLVRRRIIEVLRHNRRKESHEQGGGCDRTDHLDSPPGWDFEFRDWVEHLARQLPGPQAKLIRIHYLEANAADVAGCAARMGLRVTRVRQLRLEAQAMLREHLGVTTSRRWSRARSKVVAAVSALAGEGGRITVHRVSERSGVSASHVWSMRRELIDGGMWPVRAARKARAAS